MTKLPENMPKAGTRFVLKREVDRYPHALIPAGEAGEIVYGDKDAIGLKLDNEFKGLDEWDNELIWYSDGFGMTVEEMVFDFHSDAEPESPSPAP